MWAQGSPTIPGFYVLEFAEGDRFVVAEYKLHPDPDDSDSQFVLESLENGGYISDKPKRFHRIANPKVDFQTGQIVRLNRAYSYSSVNLRPGQQGVIVFMDDSEIHNSDMAAIVRFGDYEINTPLEYLEPIQEGEDSYTVIYHGADPSTLSSSRLIHILRCLHTITNCGLAESKEIATGTNVPLLTNCTQETARAVVCDLTNVGAQASFVLSRKKVQTSSYLEEF